MRFLTLGWIAVACGPAAAQSPIFLRPQYRVGDSPLAVVAADFDGDGRADVATANALTSDVSVLLTHGGSLGAAESHAVDASPVAIVAIDVELDGDLDLVTASSVASTVSVLLGDGAGHFAPATSFPSAALPSALAAGDLDGDGHADVVTADGGGAGTVSKLRGIGGGAFGPAAVVATFPPPYPSYVADVALVDLDDDGALDLLVAHAELARLLGDGHGSFGPPLSVALAQTGAQGQAYTIATGDFDGDGALDVAVTYSVGFGCGQIGCANVVRSVGILDGDGQGGLTAASAQTCPGATSQLPIAVADLNGDGRPEILVGAVDAIWRFANDGAGAIVAPPARFGVGSLPSGVAVADVDGDGFLDAVASVVVDDLVTVLAGDGGSGFLAPPTIAVGLDPIDVALADWDGDGRLDAAVANVTAGSVSFLAGDGEGGFLATPLAVVALASPQDLAVADFDGDGRADVVAARGSAGNAAVSLVVHVGGALAISSTTAIPAPAFVASVAVADWNLDGKIDVATANGPGDSVSLLLGDGAGGLAAPVSFAGVDLVSAVAAGDLDADGRPDLVACSLAGKSVATFRGNGAGGFAPPDESVVAESVAGPYSVATGDVNGDGRLDVVAAAHGPSAVSVFAGDGAGGLAAAVAFPTGGKPQHVAIADLDGDARADLLTTNQGSLDVSWLRNEGAGAFAAPIGFFVDMTPNASGPKVFRSAIGDLDADGRPDVVAVGGYGASPNLVTILRNRLGAAPSTLAYGAGTGGCSGHLGIAASSPPTIGNAAFGIANTNAPPSTLGLALIGDAPDPAGTDLFGLGLDLHVSLLFSTFVFGLTSASDAGGSGFAPAPLPPNPALSGATVFAQGIWVEKPGLACSAAILHLVSTKGLAFTIQ